MKEKTTLSMATQKAMDAWGKGWGMLGPAQQQAAISEQILALLASAASVGTAKDFKKYFLDAVDAFYRSHP